MRRKKKQPFFSIRSYLFFAFVCSINLFSLSVFGFILLLSPFSDNPDHKAEKTVFRLPEELKPTNAFSLCRKFGIQSFIRRYRIPRNLYYTDSHREILCHQTSWTCVSCPWNIEYRPRVDLDANSCYVVEGRNLAAAPAKIFFSVSVEDDSDSKPD